MQACLGIPDTACATKPIGEWRDTNFAGELDNILIIGAYDRITQRREFEDKFVEALANLEVSAVPRYRLITTDLVLSRNTIAAAIEGQNLDEKRHRAKAHRIVSGLFF